MKVILFRLLSSDSTVCLILFKGKKKKSSKNSIDEVDCKVNEHHLSDGNGNLVTNGCNGNGCGSPSLMESTATDPVAAPPRVRVALIEDIKEEEDVVPDLPVYDDSVNFGLRKLPRSKSNSGKK